MAHNSTHRRSLASLDSKPSMDPTHKKYPISTTTSTTKPHPTHHQQDPTLQAISNQFSKLYTNHKILTSVKGSNGGHPHPHPHPHPCVDTHLQAKAMTVSLNLDTSCTTLTKSKSHHARHLLTLPQKETTKTKVKEKVVKEAIHVHDIEKPSFVKPKTYEIKKPSSKKDCNNKDFHEQKLDMKKGSAFMSASYEGDEMKGPSFSLAMNGGGGGGRRRSFSSSQTELADFFSCSGVKVVSVDMPPFMQIHAVDCARKAYDSLEKFTAKTLAYTLKKEFDGVYGPAWHCIVGTSFGSFVTHSVGGFMYFSMDHKIYILLFKTTVRKAE